MKKLLLYFIALIGFNLAHAQCVFRTDLANPSCGGSVSQGTIGSKEYIRVATTSGGGYCASITSGSNGSCGSYVLSTTNFTGTGGLVTIEVRGSVGGCCWASGSRSSATLTVTEANPTISIGPTAVCEGTNVSISRGSSCGSFTPALTENGVGSISGTTYSTGNPTSNQTVTVTATLGACTATDAFTVYALPAVSNTSTSSICETSTKTLTGSWSGTGGAGTGTWTVQSGGGTITGGNIYNPPNVTVNTTVTVRYTVVNGSCSAFADASFTVYADPTASNTTSTASICETGTKALTGSFSGTGGAGSGVFTIQSGGGTISGGNTYNPPNVTSNTTVVIRYTVTNGDCSDFADVSFTVYADPTASNTTTTTSICETGTKSLTGSFTGTGGAGSGVFTIQSGGGTISGGNTYIPANITVNTTAVIRYTVTNGDCVDFQDVSFTVYADPTASNTTPTSPMCENSTRILAGSFTGTGGAGSGVFTVQSGGGTIAGTTYTPANVTSNTTVTIRYTVTNGDCSDFADASFTVEALPTITSSGASMCEGETRTLTSDVPGATFSGIGVSGTTFTAPNPGGVSANYTITVQNGTCSSFQIITVYAANTITSSAADMCQGDVRALTVSVGGGFFSGTGVSGSNFTAPTPAGLSQTYTISYIVPGSPCPTATQDITVFRQPTASAGGSATICETGTATVLGASASGSFSWTHDGLGSLTNAGTVAPTYTPASGDGGNTVTLTMTVTNGPCTPATATYTVNVDAPVTASAGPDQFVCINGSVVMAANSPGVGSGAWSWSPATVTYVSGSSSDFDAELSFGSSGTYTGTWTVTNGTCIASETVDIFVNSPNTVATSDVTGTCTSNSVNGWVHIYDATGNNIIASVNDNGQNLGDVTAELYYHGGAAFTVPATGSCNQDQGVLNRSFVINTAIAPSSSVSVRLYFTDAELDDLINVAGCGDNDGCEDNDDVCSINFLYVTQISGAASEDGSFTPGDGTATLHHPSNGGTGNASFGGNYVEFSVTQFSEFWIHGSESGVPLPVELISFQAKAIDNEYVQLTWSTATEINNDGFVLMRSENGIDFEKIAWVDGNGNSTETNSYLYKDTEVSKGNTYYYQLKQVDFDGQYELFDIVSAKLDGVRNLYSIGNLVPNPSKDNERVRTEIVLNQNETLNVTVYNHVGMKVQSETYNLNEGTNSIEFNIQELASGTYFVNFEGSFGNETRKLVITK